jgi:integrase
MARDRKGSIVERKGKLYARLQFIGANGRKRDLWRKADSRKQAREIIRRLLADVEQGETLIDASRMTFEALCDFYQKHYLKPPEYAGGRKVAGLRSHVGVKGYVIVFRKHFGKSLLRSIGYEHIKAFQLDRLGAPTRNHKPRTLTTVNRELAYLRRIFNIAVRKGWLVKNPFHMGDTIIHSADEPKRERILTRHEETGLLDACGVQLPLLRSLVVLALDTGCRQNELLKLTWREVDFETNTIRLLAFNTKTSRERFVGITVRAKEELLRILESCSRSQDELVFHFASRHSIQYHFNEARKKANIVDVRFHDLRHTHATRLDDLGISLAKIGAQLGHTVVQTTLRYINRDRSGIQRLAEALDNYNAGDSII